MNATETITVKLVHSTSGTLAEIHGLPQQPGPEYIAKGLLRELAEEALRSEYPALKIRAAWSCGDTGYVLQVEAL